MTNHLEEFIARAWNRFALGRSGIRRSDLFLGHGVRDDQITSVRVTIPEVKRLEHIAIIGKTGTGKSSLLKHLLEQDIRNDRGFVFFDLHGDALAFLLRLIEREERVRGVDLSKKLIVVEPADLEYSVGLNVLESGNDQQNFVQISEFSQILKDRWKLEGFGARTEELLRNSLFTLAENHLTLVELAPLLTNAGFRGRCLRQVRNQEVRAYFENRYDGLSEAMQNVFREAVLNKVTAFTADPHFRHIVGQQRSGFSVREALESGYWIILRLDKGRLGEQAATLGSLFLAKLKNALFARRSRKLFTLYCDEMQNLVSFGSGLDTLLSEARKFGISVCSANQFLDQYPTQMKSAILAVGTHVLFQLSSQDAGTMAGALGGGRHLAELLRNLPKRQMVIKSGHYRWCRAQVPEIKDPRSEVHDLYQRCRTRWAKKRSEVEAEIRERSPQIAQTEEVLDGWN